MRRPLFLLLLATIALKAAVLAQFGDHPLLQPLGDIDSGVYAGLAQRITRGDVLLRGEGSVPYFISPLYAYFLAATRASFPAARIVQILLGTAAVALVFLTARRLFGERAALAAGVLYTLTGVVTFHEVLILQAALDPFLTALSLFLLADALTHGGISSKVNVAEGAVSGGAYGWRRSAASAGWSRWLKAGVAFGLLALNRPNALLCVVAIAVALGAASLGAAPQISESAAGARRRSYSFEGVSLRSFVPVMVFLAGSGAIVALPLARNLIVSGEPVLISSHGGLNFLVGNGPGANGVYRTIPGITPDIGGQMTDTKRVAEAEEGRPLSTREVSSHLARKAWAWIGNEPGAALALLAKKVRFVLSGDEAPLNFSYPWYRDQSLPLRLLAVGPGLLVPLASAGFVLALFATSGAVRRNLFVWAVFVPAYVLAVAVFFVATRYRLPLLVALAPLGGAAVAQLPEAWRARGARLGSAVAAAAVLAVVSLWPTGLWDAAADEEMHLVLWRIERGDTGAMRHAETAAAKHPDPALVWLRVGRSFEAAGKSDEAVTALSRSHEIDSERPDTASLLSALLEKRGLARVLSGDAVGARPDLEEAVRLDGTNAAACLNLAVVLAENGDRSRARELTQRALVLRPGYDKAEQLLKALR